MPSTASKASLYVRSAMAEELGWISGRLTLKGAGDDPPFAPVYGEAYGEWPPPDWVSRGISEVDSGLPELPVILGALCPVDLVLTPSPAVARMPSKADPATAANCILACRILVALGPRLVPPAFLDRTLELRKLHDASFLAAAIGGERAIRIAAAKARRPETFVARGDADAFLSEDVEVA